MSILSKLRKGYKRMPDQIKNILKHWEMEASEIKQIYDTTWQILFGITVCLKK